MKYLLLFLTLLTVNSQAADYLSCGAGLRQHSWPQSGWLQDRGDAYSFTRCQFQPAPAIRKAGWFLSWPELLVQQGLPTGLSRSRGYLQASEWQLGWSVFRYQDLLAGISAGQQRTRQLHRLDQDVLRDQDNTLLSNGQSLLLSQDNEYVGLYLDSRYSNTPITRTSLTYHQRQQPLILRHPISTDRLSEAGLSFWKLSIERQPLHYGHLWHWSLTLLQGSIDDLSQTAASALDSQQISGAGAHLGYLWRYRLTPTLHPYLDSRISAEYWYINSPAQPALHAESLLLLDYEISAGLSWRF